MAVLVMVAVCVLMVATILSVKLLHMIWWKPKMIEKQLKKQGIHGYPYRLLYGNMEKMLELAKQSASTPLGLSHDILPHINPLFHNLATTYRKVFVVWFGTTPRVVITDPKLIKEVLANKCGSFKKIELNPITKLFGTGIASYEGDKWAKHRKIIHQAFHSDHLKQMLPAFTTSSEELIGRWNKFTSLEGCCELDVSSEFLKLIEEFITRTAFGSNSEEVGSIFSLQYEQSKLMLRSLSIMNFPLSSFLPTQLNKRMKLIYREVRTLLRVVIEKREKSMSSRQMGYNEKEDLLDLLLKYHLKDLQENQNNSNAGMSMDDIIEECKTFYVAGADTTVNLLSWSMVLLSMHQDWQQRAREEVIKILGKNKPTFDDLNNLKIVSMILLETLRLYPPTSIVRRTAKNTKLGDLHLPGGVELFIPLHTVHRDPEHWGEDALEFNPERFASGIANASNGQVSFFSFGGGPRICVGQTYAMLGAKLALSQILLNFSFELSPTYTHAPRIALTLQPQYGAQIILHKI